MIWTVFQVGLGRLLRNRVELLLTFVVPIAFFSIFALIFGNGIGQSSRGAIKTVIVDAAETPRTRMLVKKILETPGLKPYRLAGSQTLLSEQQARELVRLGRIAVAIVLHDDSNQASAELLVDPADQMSGPLAKALLSPILAAVRPLREHGIIQASGTSDAAPALASPPETAAPYDLVQFVHVLDGGVGKPVLSMYAAGIAVMFLLFGASSGGGSLLEECESQTLERLMTTKLSMDQLLLGKWVFQTTLGMFQITVMFLWGWLVFSIDLWGHLDGFLLMSLVTTSAAASFGLLLATLCRTRGQLSGLSVITILTMSALGGSMVPRYLMSDALRNAGNLTFNAWALDGFDKVFWRDLPVSSLWPQVSVLMFCSAGMLVLARLFAARWETS